MKKLIQIILFFLLAIECMQAQEWFNISPNSDSVANFSNGFFINGNEGWLKKGYPGTLWHTYNGGINWEKQIEIDHSVFVDMQFTDSLHGWVTGYTPTNPDNEYFIVRTKDGGTSWQKYPTPYLQCITFLDSVNGFAGGDSIYATTDGGINWKQQTIATDRKIRITDIFFVNKKLGWAVGEGTIMDSGMTLKTSDEGKTWQFQDSITTVGYTVYFTDSLHGYIPGSNWGGEVKITSDGGNHWKEYFLPCSWLNDVFFVNDSTGWVVGDDGFIWKTTNRGITWNQLESGTTAQLNRIFFFNNGEVGYIIGQNGTLLKYDKIVSVRDVNHSLESSFDLFQNYPNPFNPTTTIEYVIPTETKHASSLQHVVLKIYDVLGREIAKLIDENKSAGKYSVQWNGSNYSSGIYFYSIRYNNQTLYKKMLMVK